MNQKAAKLCLMFILFLAGALRLANLNQPLWPDEALYAHTARNFYKTQSLTFDGTPWRFQPPLFIFFLAFLYFILGDAEFVARISGPLLGTLTVLGVYLLAKHLYDEETGLLASLFVAIAPVHVFFTRMILADNLLVASLIFTLFFFLKYIKEGRKQYFYASSIFIAATALSKKVGFLMYPVLILYLTLQEKSFSWARRRDVQAIFLISFLMQLPWYIRNYVIFGNPLIIGFPYNSSPYSAGFTYELGEIPVFEVINFIFYSVSPPVFAVGILGFLFLLNDKKEIPALTMPLMVFLSIVLAVRYEVGRYLLPTLPFFSIFAAYGMKKFTGRRVYYPIFVSLLLFTFLFGTDFSIRLIENNRWKYEGYKEAGEWLKEHASKNAALMTNSRVLRYYSEKESIYFPEKEEDFWKTTRNYDGEMYIAIESWPTDPRMPGYAMEIEKNLKNKAYAVKIEGREIIRVYKNE